MRFLGKITIWMFSLTVIGCGAGVPTAAFAQSLATGTVPPAPAPPAPAPESDVAISLPIAELPTPIALPSDLPVAVPLSSSRGPQYAVQRACRPTERRRRIVDPNASLNAMSRATPPGAALRTIMATQIANGDAAQLALYEFDFHPGEARLNCRGMLRLLQIARQMPRLPFPLVIQSTLIDPNLDQARRAAVVNDLLAIEPSFSPDRVLVGLPPVRPLDGLDAMLIHAGVMSQSADGVPAATPAESPAAVVLPPAQ